jgi:hypothetical protein
MPRKCLVTAYVREMKYFIARLFARMAVSLGVAVASLAPAALGAAGISPTRITAHAAQALPFPLSDNRRFTLAGDNGPHGGGTNPYVTAIVHLRADEVTREGGDLVPRIEALQKRYGFSWDHSVFRERSTPSPGVDDVAIRIALRRDEIASLAREAGVVRVEPISGSPF